MPPCKAQSEVTAVHAANICFMQPQAQATCGTAPSCMVDRVSETSPQSPDLGPSPLINKYKQQAKKKSSSLFKAHG